MFYTGENRIGAKLTSDNVLQVSGSLVVGREQNEDEYASQSFGLSLNSGRWDYTICNPESNKVLQVDSRDGLVVLASESASDIQRWELLLIGMEENVEYYAIRNVASRKFMELDVSGKVSCQNFNRNGGQQWKFIPITIPGWEDDEADDGNNNNSNSRAEGQQDIADLKAEVNKLRAEIESKDKEKESDISDLKAEVNALNVKISSNVATIKEKDTLISQKGGELKQKEGQIAQLARDLRDAQNRVATSTVDGYDASGWKGRFLAVENSRAEWQEKYKKADELSDLWMKLIRALEKHSGYEVFNDGYPPNGFYIVRHGGRVVGRDRLGIFDGTARSIYS